MQSEYILQWKKKYPSFLPGTCTCTSTMVQVVLVSTQKWNAAEQENGTCTNKVREITAILTLRRTKVIPVQMQEYYQVPIFVREQMYITVVN